MLRARMMALLFATGAPAVAETPAVAGAPGWMTGCWVQNTDSVWTEECWTNPRGAMMLGAGRSGTGAIVQSWEATQILPDGQGKLIFWSSPDGAARVPFSLVSQGSMEIVFANPTHDYPQRIRYWREGRSLNAEISLADGSKPMRWHYAPMR